MDSKEQILADIRSLEARLVNIDPEWRLYMIKTPIYFKTTPIENIIDQIYENLDLPKDHFNSDEVYVMPRMIITYYLNKNRHIAAIQVMKAMKLHISNAQYYVKRAKDLIELNKNAKNLYLTLVKLYGE